MKSISYKIASSDEDYKNLIYLFKAYFDELGLDLNFQNPQKDLEDSRNMYGPPEGLAILAYQDGIPCGCVALRLFDNGSSKIGEVKRMFISPYARGQGISYKMMDILIEETVKMKYDILKLDTLHSMYAAIKVYKSYGFYETDPYYYNPLEGVVYFEKVMS